MALYTLAHELGHFVKSKNPKGFKVLADFVSNELGVNLEVLIQDKLDLWKRLGRDNLKYMDAYEDVICDALEPMFTDGKLAEKLVDYANTSKEGKGLIKTLLDFFRSLAERIKKAYANLKPDDPAAIEMLKNQKALEKAADLFAKAITGASSNFAKADVKAQKNTTSEGDVKLQAREVDAEGNEYWQIESNKDIFKGIKSIQGLKSAAYNYILHGDKGNKIVGLIDGKNLDFIRVSAKEYVYGKQSQRLSEQEYKQKMRMSTSIIDLIENASISYNAPDHKNHKLFPGGFKNYQGRVGIDETIFRYIVRVGKAKNGMIFYDINLEVDGKVPRANRTSLIKSSTSNNRVSQKENSVNTYSMQKSKNNSEKHSDRDTAYIDAVNRGDIETAQRLVDDAAKKSGYNSPLLYHGTHSFGFTNFDLERMDDKRSIFLTSSEKIASTYSGISGKRDIANAYSKNIAEMSADELVNELNSYEKQFKDKTNDPTEYELYDLDKVNSLIAVVNDGITDLSKIVDQKIGIYSDKLAADFNENDYKIHSQLVKLSEGLKAYDYNNLSTPIYMLLHNTDVFEGSKRVAELEKNIRLMNNLKNTDVGGGVIAAESLGGYWIEILTVDKARQELETKSKKGNYSLYAKLGKSLVVEGDGQLWKDIRNWNHNAFVRREDVKLKRIGDEIRLYDKTSNAEIENGVVSVNKYIEEMSDADLITLMVEKVNASLSILTENLHTTRDIAGWAKQKGYDSVTFKNIRDNGGQNSEVGYDESADIYVIFNPENVKSADPITYDDSGEVVPLSKRFDSEKNDIRYSDRGVDKRKKSYYNEFQTNAMQWAYSAATKTGDAKVFNVNGKYFTLLEATDDGYIEIAKGNYEEVKKLEEKYYEPRDSVYVHTKMFRACERGDPSDYDIAENSREHEQSSGYFRGEGLQGDVARDDEYLHSSDKESSIKKSDRDIGLDARTLLANALETTAQNDSERDWLKRYKNEIAALNADQERLNKINAEIKKISFTKGKDRSQIPKLKNQKKILEGRITKADKQLLKIEASKPLMRILEQEKAKARKKVDERVREAIKAQREKSAQTLRDTMNMYNERIKTQREGRNKTEMRHKIRRVVGDLRTLLNRGTRERNVKIGLQDTVSKALATAEILFSDEIIFSKKGMSSVKY